MVFSIVAKTGVQKSPFRDFSGTNNALGSETVYTCPAGKIARCQGTLKVDSHGTATDVRMRGAGGAKVINIKSVPAENRDSVFRSGPFVLEAGDTCIVSANLGVTSDADWTLSVEELPA